MSEERGTPRALLDVAIMAWSALALPVAALLVLSFLISIFFGLALGADTALFFISVGGLLLAAWTFIDAIEALKDPEPVRGVRVLVETGILIVAGLALFA